MLGINFATSEIVEDNLLASQESSFWDRQINVIDVSKDGQQQVLEIYNFFKDMFDKSYSNGKCIADTNITFSGTNGTYNTQTSEHFQSVVDWYYKNLDRDMPDGTGGEIQVLTNVDWVADTAFYIEHLDAFIFGKQIVSPKNTCDIMDTIMHEYTHSVFSHINYGAMASSPELVSIMEGYSDIMLFAMTDNWIFGEDMQDPTYIRDYTNPDKTDEFGEPLPESYKDLVWINVHSYRNSSILIRAAYNMSQSGLGSKDIAKIWYQSMFYGYSNQSSFITVKNNVLMAAMDLGYSQTVIDNIKTSFEIFGV
jgi:Zn-dependent metalloprotease